jgi:hypothetical protein
MSWIPGWDSIAGSYWWENFYFSASIGALILLGVAEVISHRYSQRKDVLAAIEQSDTQRRHDDEIARLHLETAATNERAANLEHENALIRQKNLELEKALEPRLLEQLYSSEALKPFAEIQAFIVSVPDFEARRLASQMAVMFQMAGWTHKVVPSTNAEAIIDGVEVQYITIALPDILTDDSRARNERHRAAAQAIVEQLVKSGIEAHDSFILSPYAPTMWDQRFSIDAIAVRVGLKPITYFVNKLRDQSPHRNAVFGNH